MSTEESIKFSIITPTYNRAQLLPVLAESLKIQHRHILEWIIIDDASSDNTFIIVDQLKQGLPFDLVYKSSRKNRGMVHALNIGFSLVRANYFFKIDSDDYLLPDGLEIIYSTINQLRDLEDTGSIYAYSFSANNRIGKTLNDTAKLESRVKKYSDGIYLSSYSSCRSSNWVTGDLLDVFPSRPVLDHFRYPIYSSDRHCPSGLIHYFLADYCKTKIAYNIIPVLVKDYQQDGVSSIRSTLKTNTLDTGPSSYLTASLWELLINKRNPLAYINSVRRFIRSIFMVIKKQLNPIGRTKHDIMS